MNPTKSLSGEPRRRRTRRVPDGYISVNELAITAPVSKGTIYSAIKKRQLSACLWRGKLIVPEAAAAEFFAIKPLDLGALASGVAECCRVDGNE